MLRMEGLAAGAHALNALRGADFGELLQAMGVAVGQTAVQQGQMSLQAAGLPVEQQAASTPLTDVHLLLKGSTSQSFSSHLSQLDQVRSQQATRSSTPWLSKIQLWDRLLPD